MVLYGGSIFGDALAYLDEVERHYGAEVKRDFFCRGLSEDTYVRHLLSGYQ